MNTSSEQTTTYGKALRAERIHHNLTQRQLADAVGTTQQNVGAWEHGKSLPRPETHAKIVALFGKNCLIANHRVGGERMIVMAAKSGHVDHDAMVEDVNYRERPVVAAPTSPDDCPQCRDLAALFAMLPQDLVVRTRVYSQCATLILASLSPTSVPAPEPAPAHKS